MIMKWIMENQAFLGLITNVLLVIVTSIYVILTGKMVRFAEKQVKVISNPVISVNITKMHISKTYGNKRRNLKVSLDLHNIGNAPAIDILIDGELVYESASIEGNKKIPHCLEPRKVPFLKSNDSIINNDETSVFFGNNGVNHLFDDFKENDKLNLHRIEVDPSLETFPGSKLCIFIYYSNNLGQQFESYYEAYIKLQREYLLENNVIIIKDKQIPKEYEEMDLSFHPYIRPTFYSNLIEKNKINEQLKQRDQKRKLCGH